MIQNVFRAEGLPLDLAFIPIIESGFKTNALSRASAKGPWQFMVPTAKDHGLNTNWFIDERSDFEKSTVAAAKYLKMLAKMFDNDWHLVLAAYNGVFIVGSLFRHATGQRAPRPPSGTGAIASGRRTKKSAAGARKGPRTAPWAFSYGRRPQSATKHGRCQTPRIDGIPAVGNT